jgi:hypothetical protein
MTAAGPPLLDWYAFTAAYFPGRRRHDFEALVAYGAYRRGERFQEPEHATAGEADAPQSDALEVWEDEGGPVG